MTKFQHIFLVPMLMALTISLFSWPTAFAADCGDMYVWDVTSQMCMPYPMPNMPMSMAMLSGDLFGTRIWETGTRGRDAYAGPDWVMGDIGTSVGDRQYINLDVMATAEKWLFPDRGYPLLLQIGEENQQGVPFVDAQHPHSSPIMGLTLSDTIALENGKDNLKVFFAPRGESTDGPIAFMHRITAEVNPDVPLGHHVGQDVGHISSTVIGASLRLDSTIFEASTFHGAEPDPEAVNLPLGKPDSFALRLIEEFSPAWTGMISAARVDSPEPNEPDVLFETRYSASAYAKSELGDGWTFHDSLIYGLINQYDHVSALSSFTEEFLFAGDRPRIWGRVELLERTGAELEISDSNHPEWVAAFTVGYTERLVSFEGADLGVGGSVTKDLLPGDFIGAYGFNPWSGKIFLQLSGSKMWNLL